MFAIPAHYIWLLVIIHVLDLSVITMIYSRKDSISSVITFCTSIHSFLGTWSLTSTIKFCKITKRVLYHLFCLSVKYFLHCWFSQNNIFRLVWFTKVKSLLSVKESLFYSQNAVILAVRVFHFISKVLLVVCQ